LELVARMMKEENRRREDFLRYGHWIVGRQRGLSTGREMSVASGETRVRKSKGEGREGSRV